MGPGRWSNYSLSPKPQLFSLVEITWEHHWHRLTKRKFQTPYCSHWYLLVLKLVSRQNCSTIGLNLDFAIYNRVTTKDIVGASISRNNRLQNAVFNVGELTNKGVELLLSYRVVDTKNFTWEPSINFGYNRNKVVSLTEGLKRIQVDEPRSRTAYVYQEVGKAFSQLVGFGYT